MEDTKGLVGGPGDPLLLVNVWDATSTRVAVAAGARAVGTTSWGVGLDGGGHVEVAPEVVAAAGDVPVSIDVERGGPDIASTIERVLAAGAVGVNIEDVDPARPGALVPVDEQSAWLAAARHAGGDGVFINARTDVWFGAAVEGDQLEEAVRRADAYAAAGADGFFVPGLLDLEVLRELCRRVTLPVNVMIGMGVPAVADLGAAGVRRVSQGGEPFLAAIGAHRAQLDAYLRGELASDPTAMMTGASMLPTFVS